MLLCNTSTRQLVAWWVCLHNHHWHMYGMLCCDPGTAVTSLGDRNFQLRYNPMESPPIWGWLLSMTSLSACKCSYFMKCSRHCWSHMREEDWALYYWHSIYNLSFPTVFWQPQVTHSSLLTPQSPSLCILSHTALSSGTAWMSSSSSGTGVPLTHFIF